MSDVAINGSGIETVEVVFTHNVLGYRRGDRAILPVNTPELAECIGLDFVRLVVDGEEQVPDLSVSTPRRGCSSCGG